MKAHNNSHEYDFFFEKVTIWNKNLLLKGAVLLWLMHTPISELSFIFKNVLFYSILFCTFIALNLC